MQQIGRYQVVGEIARGGAGVVYRARDPEAGEVAIKVLLTGRRASAQQRNRFEREVAVLARLTHPHLVATHDHGVHKGVPYLVMDFVQGRTLEERLEAHGPLPVREAVEVAIKLAGAIEYAHQQGVVHRDVKPGNVIEHLGGEPVLTDFGIAKDLDPPKQGVSTLTGIFLGTPGFWPPEQASGRLDEVGPASDVYALGATLYALLTRGPPFSGGSLVELLVRTREELPEPPSKRRPEVDPVLERIVLRCLEKAPTDRFPSAAALAAALEEWLTTPVRRGSSWGRVALRIAVVATLVLLVVVGAVFLAGKRSDAKLEALSAKGNACWDAGDLEGARQAIEGALVLDPESVHLHHLLARVLLGLRELDAAEEQLRLSLSVGGRDGRILTTLAQVHLVRGDDAVALQCLDEALTLDPEQSDALGVRGRLRGFAGDYAGALQDFERAIALAPKAAGHYMRRAWTHVEAGEPEQALPDFARALEIDPEHRTARADRADAYEKLGRWEEALADLNLAVAAAPDDDPLRERRAKVRSRLRDFAGAREDYARILEGRPDGDARVLGLRALTFEDEGNLAEARVQFELAIAIDPQLGYLHAGRGRVRSESGDAGALTDFNEALRLEPEVARHWFDRGVHFRGRREFTKAAEDFERSAALAPTNPEARRELALTLFLASRFAEARRSLDQAEAMGGTTDSIFYFTRARLKYVEDDWRGALDDVTLALALDPDQPRAWFLRASCRVELGESGGVLADLDRAKGDGTNGGVTFYRGVVLERMGDDAGALRAYRAAEKMEPEGFAVQARAAIAHLESR